LLQDAIAAGHNLRRQIQNPRVGYRWPQNVEQDRVVYGRKVLHHIETKDILITPRKGLQPIHSAVGALPRPICVTVDDEPPFEDRFDYIAQGMVHHPVGERRCADPSSLRFVNLEMNVFSRRPASLPQRRLNREQLVGRLKLELRNGLLAALPRRRLPVCVEKIRPGNYLFKTDFLWE